jgi:hypothetical protein
MNALTLKTAAGRLETVDVGNEAVPAGPNVESKQSRGFWAAALEAKTHRLRLEDSPLREINFGEAAASDLGRDE